MLQDAIGLPRGPYDGYPDECREAWETLDAATDAQIEEWLASGEGRSISVALWLLDRRGKAARIAQLSTLLDCDLVSLPHVMQGAEGGLPRAGGAPPAVVKHYVSALIGRWFNVDLSNHPGWPVLSFEEAFAGVTDFESLGYPRLVRLERARTLNRPESETAPLLAAIVALPEETRWAIVARGQRSGVITEDEAKTILAAMTTTFKARLLSDEPIACPEPAFRSNATFRAPATLLDETRKAARAMLTPTP